MDNRKVTGILNHKWDLGSQIWRLWTHTTTSLLLLHLPPSTIIWEWITTLVTNSYSLQFGDHFPLLLLEWTHPTLTTLVTTSYFHHFGGASYPHHFNDYLQPSLVLWPPPNLIILVTYSNSIHFGKPLPLLSLNLNPSYNHLPLPLPWEPPFTPKTLVTISHSKFSTSYQPSTTISTTITILLSPKYVSSHNYIYQKPGLQNHKNNHASPKSLLLQLPIKSSYLPTYSYQSRLFSLP